MASVRPGVRRDSLYGERILWRGRPTRPSLPWRLRLVVLVASTLSACGLAFAAVVARGLGQPPGGLVAFSAWCATLALAAFSVPRLLHGATEYLVTDRHVIARIGPFRRSIERAAVSYAIVRWSPTEPGEGDLELVRAVPTGALRRTLRLGLPGVRAPDRLWALVRGVEASEPLGDGARPLAQRLDEGERVLWSAAPRGAHWSARRLGRVALAAFVLVAVGTTGLSASRAVLRVLGQHALGAGVTVALVAGVALGIVLGLGVALGLGYHALVRPVRMAHRTRYFVTDRRVLIRRGDEELHLDRAHIAEVIAHAGVAARGDLFLVLDGPHARGFSPTAAFGRDEGAGLEPVLWALDDVETPRRLLAAEPADAGRLSDAA